MLDFLPRVFAVIRRDLFQVTFEYACTAVVYNMFPEGDSRFECFLHKGCGFLVGDNTFSVTGTYILSVK